MTHSLRNDEAVPPDSIGPVDEIRMRAAAEDLRERTMSLEHSASAVPWLFATLVVATVVALVALLMVYRQPLQLWIRGSGRP